MNPLLPYISPVDASIQLYFQFEHLIKTRTSSVGSFGPSRRSPGGGELYQLLLHLWLIYFVDQIHFNVLNSKRK